MRARLALLLTALLLLVIPVQADTDCLLPTRLVMGETGRVLPGLPQRIRIQPDTSLPQFRLMQPGSEFTVLDGPVCAQGYQWWKVDYQGIRGWTAEGSDGEYWLEPVTGRNAITADNASQLEKIGFLGRGTMARLAWLPDNTLRIISEQGVRRYNAMNLSEPPKWSALPDQFYGWDAVISPDFRYVVNTDGRSIRLWDTASGTHPVILDGISLSSGIFSADNTYLALVAYAYTENNAPHYRITMLDVAATHVLWDKILPDNVNLRFSLDNTLLLAGTNAGTMFLDVVTGQQVNAAPVVGDISPSLRWQLSQDGTTLIATDRQTGQTHELMTLTGNHIVTRFTPDESLVAVTEIVPKEKAQLEELITLFDMRTWRKINTFNQGGQISYLGGTAHNMDIVPESDALLVVLCNSVCQGPGYGIRLWRISTGALVTEIPEDDRYVTTDVAINPDKTQAMLLRVDGTLTRLDLRTGRVLETIAGYRGYARTALFTHDSRRVIAGERATTRIWDIATQSRIGELPGCEYAAMHPFQELLACFTDGVDLNRSELSLIDINTGQQRLIDENFDSPFELVAFSPDGKTLAASDNDGHIRFYDVATGQFTHETEGGDATGYVAALVYSPDGRYIAAAPNGSLWDTATGKQVVTMQKLMAWGSNTVFSPDGALYAATLEDAVYVWNTADLLQAGTASPENAVYHFDYFELTGQKFNNEGDRARYFSDVTLAFHPDGNILLIAAGGLQLWDIAAHRRLTTLNGRGGIISFSPDGSLIMTADGQWFCGCADESYHLGGVMLWSTAKQQE